MATLHFVIPEDLKTELVEEAKRENRSVTATTLMAIRQYLTALDREREPKDTA